MRYKVLIVGAGQLGSRYLQGLSLCALDLDISVVDVYLDSLERARLRWEEVSGTALGHHCVTFTLSMPDSGSRFDLVIIATSAAGRVRIIKQCREQYEIRYWIIEKVLAQSPSELDVIAEVLADREGVWVNTPRRIIRWHQQLRDALAIQGTLTCSVSGGNWGLACNAVHMLDLVAWWTGQELVRVDTGKLARQWHESKRPGFFEVHGELSAYYADGTSLVLASSDTEESTSISLRFNGEEWLISESNGRATSSKGESVSGTLEYQSVLTGSLVELILKTGNCGLPTLQESLQVHRPFLSAMLEHWNATMPEQRMKVPLT